MVSCHNITELHLASAPFHQFRQPQGAQVYVLDIFSSR